jgi:transcription-repair coupling factor (superfamily II helicase)
LDYSSAPDPCRISIFHYFCKKIQLQPRELTGFYAQSIPCKALLQQLDAGAQCIRLTGLAGSSAALAAAAMHQNPERTHLIILQDKESAAYFLNDLEHLFEDTEAELRDKKILFFPSSYKRPGDYAQTDNAGMLLRTETLNRLAGKGEKPIIVTYPEAVGENVAGSGFFQRHALHIEKGEDHPLELLTEKLQMLAFDRVDFVTEPGQYAVRGGIMDVFSFSDENPFRIEFNDTSIESLRTFDPVSQLSVTLVDSITVVPDMYLHKGESMASVFSYLSNNAAIWTDDAGFMRDRIDGNFRKAAEFFNVQTEPTEMEPLERFATGNTILQALSGCTVIEFGRHAHFESTVEIAFQTSPQPSFNKNFNLLLSQLREYGKQHYRLLLLSDTKSQLDRLRTIISDLLAGKPESLKPAFDTLQFTLHEGFIDHSCKLLCFTDHQIFDRYHRFRLRDSYSRREAITLKEIFDLKPGDYVTHVDHGIGRYGGLEKMMVNGKQQEAIRIVYENNDLLYVSIHSLHRISKYAGKDGAVPSLNRLGSNAWNKLKNRARQRVKDIAKDLIALYAKRKATPGFAFMPDTYMQHELEASFMYEDTPDQFKATRDVKTDMENDFPMDRLICGDVGFGKTEVALRAAFKAVADNKQVAVLVPTTILALQHFNTFNSRLQEFPCKIDYLNRFRSTAEQKEILRELADGKTDILIGTHRLISKDVAFKDLGLLIIDEEQKFGVSAKEKLKQLRVNVDTLTLTATPIPRTLQFSLMGARDLSIISTPPANRYPIQTELHVFNEEVIRDAILYELSRGGQVFVVHNRIENIGDIAALVRKLCPQARVAVGHGQMPGNELEKTMLDFISGQYDVLVATTIIESGLDIPNANTIVINEAHHYGLSDLHQLRGRVGRTNVRAFCYLLAPPLSLLTEEARKRLKAIEEFSDLGSGFNIAMRDLDIRGAGNILGGEQSGFISEIGFEMYHKILDDAIRELKETEYRELYKDELEKQPAARDCIIETDLEILLPDSYVENIHERLALYKELDNIEDETGLQQFRNNLLDRFGPLPTQAEELANIVRLRHIAKRAGMERIYLREGKLTGYFISNPESDFFASEIFVAVLHFVRDYKGSCRMKEQNQKLSIIFNNVSSVSGALQALAPLDAMLPKPITKTVTQRENA